MADPVNVRGDSKLWTGLIFVVYTRNQKGQQCKQPLLMRFFLRFDKVFRFQFQIPQGMFWWSSPHFPFGKATRARMRAAGVVPSAIVSNCFAAKFGASFFLYTFYQSYRFWNCLYDSLSILWGFFWGLINRSWTNPLNLHMLHMLWICFC